MTGDPATRYEYREVSARTSELVDVLNDYGRDGWQVVLAAPDKTVVGYPSGTVYVLLTRSMTPC